MGVVWPAREGHASGFASAVRLGYREDLSPFPQHLLECLVHWPAPPFPPLPPGLLPPASCSSCSGHWKEWGREAGNATAVPPMRGLSPWVGPQESPISPSGLCGLSTALPLRHSALCWASEGWVHTTWRGRCSCDVLYRFKGFIPNFLGTGLPT